jgi:hypothetical protein
MTQIDTLSRGRARFVAALLQETTLSAAADRAGIARSTANRWIHEPEVRGALRDAQAAMLDKITASIGAACTEAVGALRDVVNDPEASPSARVGAARTLLRLWPMYVEDAVLLPRIEALEAALLGEIR